MQFSDYVGLALRSLGGNILRSLLTLSIIAIGIMALIGILTAIDGIRASISTNFASLGAGSFEIEKSGGGMDGDGPKKRELKPAPPITYEEAKRFKEQLSYPATVSFSVNAKMFVTAKYDQKKTNPNLFLNGADENYLETAGLEIEYGRYFTVNEANNITNGIVIGKSIAEKLFKNGLQAIDKIIDVDGQKYKVIGILASKGNSSIFSADNNALISITTARYKYPDPKQSFSIKVAVTDPSKIENAISESMGTMRNVRKLSLTEPDDFEIDKSDKLSGILIDQLQYVTIAATIIGLITLIGAGIGLMNIMLVSVAERTREIGISKSIGATNKSILYQFLLEAILLCLIGGLFGILLGIIAGNAVSIAINGPFIIPWFWIICGILFCVIVGILAGIFPAIKAAKVDPIESLRYE